MTTARKDITPLPPVERMIYFVRGQKVMLDSELAVLYRVATKVLNQAVRRNVARFPTDFMFQLTPKEAQTLMRSQIVTSSEPDVVNAAKAAGTPKGNWSQIVTSSQKHRGRKYRPLVFTEQGVAMLSSVLRSPRAIQVNVEIMRAFVRLRQLLGSNIALGRKLAVLEKKYDRQFKIVFDAIRELMTERETAERPPREIGFHAIPSATRDRSQRAQRK